MFAMSSLIYITLALVTAIMMATSSFGCSDKPRLSASRHRNLLMGNSHMFYQGTMHGFSLAGHAYRNTTARSYVTCTVLCLLDDACKSFNYCIGDKLCQLNSAVYTEDETSLQATSDCIYFDESFHEDLFRVEIPQALPCTVYSTPPDLEADDILQPPIHLEFTAFSETEAIIELESDSFNLDYKLVFTSTTSKIETSGTDGGQSEGNWNFTGSRVIVNVNESNITVGIKGISESFYCFLLERPNPNSWEIGIKSDGSSRVEWHFLNPCFEFTVDN